MSLPRFIGVLGITEYAFVLKKKKVVFFLIFFFLGGDRSFGCECVVVFVRRRFQRGFLSFTLKGYFMCVRIHVRCVVLSHLLFLDLYIACAQV